MPSVPKAAPAPSSPCPARVVQGCSGCPLPSLAALCFISDTAAAPHCSDFSFPFCFFLPLLYHPPFSIFYLLHFSSSSPSGIAFTPLCQQEGQISLPSAPPSCCSIPVSSPCCSLWQVCDWRSNKINSTFGNKRSGFKTCFFSHLLQRTPWLGRAFLVQTLCSK